MIDKRIGKRIKEQREALGLTQEQFAEKIGVTTNYISTVERGASFPRCEKLILLLNGLETSADAISVMFLTTVRNTVLHFFRHSLKSWLMTIKSVFLKWLSLW